MPQRENRSEVACLRERIELECQAVRRMFDQPASVASHDSIEARYRDLNGLKESLIPLVGGTQAMEVVMDIYMEIVDTPETARPVHPVPRAKVTQPLPDLPDDPPPDGPHRSVSGDLWSGQ